MCGMARKDSLEQRGTTAFAVVATCTVMGSIIDNVEANLKHVRAPSL